MAGSLVDRIYTADSGGTMVKRLDESNAEATGFADYTALSISSRIPIVKEMRRIRCVDPVSGAERIIPVGNPDDDLWTGVASNILLPLLSPAGLLLALTLFEVVERLPEKLWPEGRSGDTGLDDGDAS